MRFMITRLCIILKKQVMVISRKRCKKFGYCWSSRKNLFRHKYVIPCYFVHMYLLLKKFQMENFFCQCVNKLQLLLAYENLVRVSVFMKMVSRNIYSQLFSIFSEISPESTLGGGFIF